MPETLSSPTVQSEAVNEQAAQAIAAAEQIARAAVQNVPAEIAPVDATSTYVAPKHDILSTSTPVTVDEKRQEYSAADTEAKHAYVYQGKRRNLADTSVGAHSPERVENVSTGRHNETDGEPENPNSVTSIIARLDAEKEDPRTKTMNLKELRELTRKEHADLFAKGVAIGDRLTAEENARAAAAEQNPQASRKHGVAKRIASLFRRNKATDIAEVAEVVETTEVAEPVIAPIAPEQAAEPEAAESTEVVEATEPAAEPDTPQPEDTPYDGLFIDGDAETSLLGRAKNNRADRKEAKRIANAPEEATVVISSEDQAKYAAEDAARSQAAQAEAEEQARKAA
jgi:hypothetical protein